MTTAITFRSDTTSQPHHDHCPLCIDSIVHPKDDPRPPAIIFLDMDGVMFNQNVDDLPECGTHYKSNDYDFKMTQLKAKYLNDDAQRCLNKLIERIERAGKRALIVLITTWRNDATLKQHREEVFADYKFCKYLCAKAAPQESETDITPECKLGFDFNIGAKKAFDLTLYNKHHVVEFWLKDHQFDPKHTNYIIIDDDPDFSNEHHIQPNPQTLFSQADAEQACSLLKV